MNARMIITAFLLAFVATSLVYVGMREAQPVASASITAQAASVDDPVPYVAYYFHGNVRCATCIAIEERSRSAVLANFDLAIQAGTLAWREVNYDAAENAHFRKQFELSFQSLVLVEQQSGRVARWDNLKDAWIKIHDAPEVYEDFVVTSIENFMADSQL